MRDDRTYLTEPYMPQNPDSNVGDEYIIKRNPNLIEIPDNATNGDVIKALLKTTIQDINCAFIWIDCGEGYCPAKFDIDWWNAPYKKEGR